MFIQRIKYNNDQLQIQLHKKILQTRNLMKIALENILDTFYLSLPLSVEEITLIILLFSPPPISH